MLHLLDLLAAETQPILGLQWDQWLGKNATGKLGVLRDPARPRMAGG
jgi:hypothetical protein